MTGNIVGIAAHDRDIASAGKPVIPLGAFGLLPRPAASLLQVSGGSIKFAAWSIFAVSLAQAPCWT